MTKVRARTSTLVLALVLAMGSPDLASAASPASPASAASPASPASPASAGSAGSAVPPFRKATPASVASTPAPLPPPRPVDVILTDAINALGGETTMARHRSMHTKMEITFAGLGITGTAEHFAAVGDKVLSTMSIPSLASTREGGDGSRYWSDDPINGLRVLEGAEVEQARVEAAWNAELRTKELFPKIESKNERSDDGALLECLILTPKSGAATTDCYDPVTHLLAVQRGVRAGPQGDMPFVAKLKDWRKVADLKVAFVTEMQVGPLAFVGRTTSVEIDVPIDAAMFAVPRAPMGAFAPDGAGGAPGKTKPRISRKPAATLKVPPKPSPAR